MRRQLSVSSVGNGRSASSRRNSDSEEFSPTSPIANEVVARDLSAGVTKGTVLPAREASDPSQVSVDEISQWAKSLQDNSHFRLAETVLSKTSMGDVLCNRAVMIRDQAVFNNQVSIEGNPVANQLRTGRCWLFATTNVIRTYVARKYNLDEFQLSQSYLFFYDHLAKAEWFLNQIIDLADKPLDDQLVRYLMAGTQSQDGGQYDMAVNLIERYGLVPQVVYPESYNSSFSKELDELLASKLREDALDLRSLHGKLLKKGRFKNEIFAKCMDLKKAQMKEIYRILAITCGTPPEPNEKFVWEFKDKKKNVQRVVCTPLEFVRFHTDYDVSAGVPLVHDPRNEPTKGPEGLEYGVFTVDRLGNVPNGRPIKYVGARISDLKKAAIASIQANVPVWFGSDVGKAKSYKHGILDTALFHYDDAFGCKISMDKRERVNTGDSAMNHAMILTGVHLDENSNPVRWRVENSWGPNACNKGFFTMNDDWFTENVFQVVALPKFIPPRIMDAYTDRKTHIQVLPAWDPMGTLASSNCNACYRRQLPVHNDCFPS